jgi:hypothetical protein
MDKNINPMFFQETTFEAVNHCGACGEEEMEGETGEETQEE